MTSLTPIFSSAPSTRHHDNLRCHMRAVVGRGEERESGRGSTQQSEGGESARRSQAHTRSHMRTATRAETGPNRKRKRLCKHFERQRGDADAEEEGGNGMLTRTRLHSEKKREVGERGVEWGGAAMPEMSAEAGTAGGGGAFTSGPGSWGHRRPPAPSS